MKKIFTMVMSLVMITMFNTTCFAAGWQQNAVGYWYENEDGTWPSNTWQWIDGNRDGKAECYYFDENGYMLSNTITPDGYLVNLDGAWMENGVVQIQNVPVAAENRSDSTDIESDITSTVEINTMAEAEQYAKKVWEIVNQERQSAGKASLEWDDSLAVCAAKRAEELVEVFSHSRPDRSSCFSIYQEYGVRYMAAGENIAWGQATPESVMNSWMNSTGHKANILDSNFGKIGVGCYNANGRYYWVQMFTD